MNDLCKRALVEFIRVVDERVQTVTDVEENSRKYDSESMYKFWVNTEVYGAYWAFRAMVRDAEGFVDCYMRMEEYFDAKCKAIVKAFEEK